MLYSRAFLMYGMQALVAAQIENFVMYLPRQKAASFNLDAVMRQIAPTAQQSSSNKISGKH
jgi:hypothetical protein